MHHQTLVLSQEQHPGETHLGLGLHLQLSALGGSWAGLGQGKVAFQGLTGPPVPVPAAQAGSLCLTDSDGAAGDSKVAQPHWGDAGLAQKLLQCHTE